MDKILTEETLMLTDIRAENDYDFEKIQVDHPLLLSCNITRQKESILLTYDTRRRYPFEDIRSEKEALKLSVLISLYQTLELIRSYSFALTPQNIYYDRQGNVFIKFRDICDRQIKAETYFQSYKAMIGFCLQRKYTYEDYMEGGMELLCKNPFLSQVHAAGTPKELRELLYERYDSQYEESLHQKVEIRGGLLKKLIIYATVITVVLLAGGGFLFYQLFDVNRVNRATIAGYGAYMDHNFVNTIDTLSFVEIGKMNTHTKYILAESYINSEYLTAEQKENILSDIAPNGNERLLDYWIYIGRTEYTEAENIAMQLSDDEMLLYAYMKEQNQIEINTTMSGEDKKAALAVLEEKIKKLSEQYQKQEETPQDATEQTLPEE
ncbi:MAG: type VII secretion protein EssB/YukC [bacterium]|nr:type VII secretion protein EssB/YukC [bacterium]